MAHVGQELALRARRLLGALLGHFQLAHELCQSRGIVALCSLGQLQFPRVTLELLLSGLAFGDIARRREDETLFGTSRRRPDQPAIRSVMGSIAVLERHDRFPRREAGRGGPRRVAVVRVDEVQVRRTEQLLLGVSQLLGPCRVHTQEPSVGGGDTKKVAREGEEMIEPILRLPLRHEQTNLAADGTKQLEQRRVRRADFPAEEFHHAADLAVDHQREAERGAQPVARGHLGARKIHILEHVRNPRGRPARPDASGQAHARAQTCTCGWPLRTP